MSFRSKLTLVAILVLAALTLAVWTQAAERDWRKVDPFKHNLQEIANATVQAVIDSTLDYVTLPPDSAACSDWIWTQSLSHAFASYATFVVRLDSGAIAVWFVEEYWVGMDSVVHSDSSHVVFSRDDSLCVPGQYSEAADPRGGRRFKFCWEALGTDTAGFQPGYQLMR